MRPVKMLLGLAAGLVIVMFIAKVLLFGLLLAVPIALLFFAAKGLRHQAWERRFDYRSSRGSHLYTAWKANQPEPLFYENEYESEKPFDWMTNEYRIQVR